MLTKWKSRWRSISTTQINTMGRSCMAPTVATTQATRATNRTAITQQIMLPLREARESRCWPLNLEKSIRNSSNYKLSRGKALKLLKLKVKRKWLKKRKKKRNRTWNRARNRNKKKKRKRRKSRNLMRVFKTFWRRSGRKLKEIKSQVDCWRINSWLGASRSMICLILWRRIVH